MSVCTPKVKNADSVCGKCGAKIFADLPQNVCGACLLRAGLGLLEENEGVADPAQTPSRSHGARSAEMLGEFGDFDIARREDGCLWELGHGAMGVTYLAMDKVLRRRVALKVIDVPAVPTCLDSQAMRERFLREARA